ncbi:MAG TPA: serine/threonine-protein kinase, partial [Actinomycetota bacterium]|nr:serine/threonine-protein kinase [Actinomycetota bacterium]
MPETVLLADRYELRGPLGRGGMGEVYDGWDHRLDRPVAIKILNSQLASQADVRTRFESEARAAARLANPKVVGVFDTGEHDGIPYIVMERLPGRTLADEIAGGPLSQERVRAVLLDMLEALGFAHRAGVLHRDVKPSNVLLTEDGTAKLADFGIAKMAGQNLTQTGNFVGTAAYLAPERLNGLPAGPESDLYSAGVVAYEALTGDKP